TGMGGTVKRYEIQLDANRLKRFGLTLQQVQSQIAASNGNVGGDYLVQGHTVQVMRSLGLLGNGKDPMDQALAMKTPGEAAAFLRDEEGQRIREVRQIVIASVNNVPIRIDDIVQGGPLPYDGAPSRQGVVVAYQTRLGKVSISKPPDRPGQPWTE